MVRTRWEERSGAGLNAILEGFKSLGAGRLVALAAVALGMLALLAVLATRGGTDRMALLYGDLDLREAAQMADALERAHIPHQSNGAGSEMLVPSDQVAQARLLLAKDGLPSGGSVGYEIFDRGDALTANQFQQGINQSRALEGELARTIRLINGVRAARVHLVMPHREPFSRERQDAQASVMLTFAGASRIDKEGIQAILNLVAAAVPGLRPQSIAIVDTRGNMLARAGQPAGLTDMAQTQDEMRRATEMRLARAVEQMLERTLGPGRVRAEAAVEMNFDQVHETQEKFDPDGQVVRSSQNVTDNSKSTEANPNVSVQNNLPNANADAPGGTGTQDARQDETTNYEIGKTVRTLVREQPQIQRISLAVMVDGLDERGPDGTVVWKERSADDIARLTKLVRSAVGFDEKRGDHVDVVSMRFVDEAGPVGVDGKTLFGIPVEKSDIMRLAQTLLVGVIGILALLFVLRPMVMRLTAIPGAAQAMAAGVLPGGGGLALAGAEGGVPRLAGPGAGAGGTPGEVDETMVNLSNVEGQLRMSSIRRVAELIDKHPEESLSLVRAWMHQEAGA